MSSNSTIERLARTAGPSVVGLGRGARGGSGVVVERDRVVSLARNLRGDDVDVAFGSGRRAAGHVLGADPDLGVVVIEVETEDAPAVPWRAEDPPLAIGAAVYALADPGGRGLRATPGTISTEPGRMRGARGRLIEGMVEHTAPLPRGAGGSALLDGEGRLVGLNALRRDGGLVLALPAAAIRRFVEAVAAGRVAQPPRLGVAIGSPRASRRLRAAVGLPERDGLLVRAVESGSAAEEAGLARGDLIVAAGGRDIREPEDLYAALDAAAPGAQLALSVVRGTDEVALSATLPGEPAAQPR